MSTISRLTKRDKITALIVVGVVFLIGFLIGYEYKTQEIKKAVNEAFSSVGDKSDNKSTTDYTKEEDGKDGYETTYHEAGEVIKYSTIDMKFNSARSTKTLTAQYSEPMVAEKGTKFIVVNHTVTNTGKSPFTYKELMLFDKDGRVYNADVDTIMAMDNYMTGRELAPGVPETGDVAFVVPGATKEFEFGGRNAETDKIDVVKFKVN